MIFKQCFVFDLDETLVNVQGKDIFVRPYSDSILNILSCNSNNILILWSTGDFSYVYNVLVRLNWCHYFDKILTRDDCENSFKLYDEYKSCLFVKNLYKVEDEIYKIIYILIDDLAYRNETKNIYDYKINIVPYKSTRAEPDIHLFNAIKCFL